MAWYIFLQKSAQTSSQTVTREILHGTGSTGSDPTQNGSDFVALPTNTYFDRQDFLQPFWHRFRVRCQIRVGYPESRVMGPNWLRGQVWAFNSSYREARPNPTSNSESTRKFGCGESCWSKYVFVGIDQNISKNRNPTEKYSQSIICSSTRLRHKNTFFEPPLLTLGTLARHTHVDIR